MHVKQPIHLCGEGGGFGGGLLGDERMPDVHRHAHLSASQPFAQQQRLADIAQQAEVAGFVQLVLQRNPDVVSMGTSILIAAGCISCMRCHVGSCIRGIATQKQELVDRLDIEQTTANIAGNEINQAVIETYYPDLVKDSPISPVDVYASTSSLPSQQYQNFTFSKEMYQTRITVDEFLVEGKIDEAEQFMESQRLYFWENGYQIRKLNQAYFAFHGAYADEPFSAAGRDSVGDDVRLFRERQTSLASFIKKISWMYNYNQLRIAARTY